jgi:hypothetical protein
MWYRIKYHPFFIRLFHWEYWPMYISNIPVLFFWLIHAVRARDLFFFTAINPVIPTGGFFGEQKHQIYALIPPKYLPKTMYFRQDAIADGSIIHAIVEAGISYPLICKPDIGERGLHVKVIQNASELIAHAQRIPGGVIIQEYISYPLELSIMLHRFPKSGRGGVTSICRKVFLSVTGDGSSTLEELIDRKPRAILQKDKLARRFDLTRIPDYGEDIVLEGIGNHCLGTQFLNANAWITPELEKAMLGILSQIPDVFYGRFDLRTSSIEMLTQGKEFLIMELNGASSEPAHIYDPEYGPRRAYRDLWDHWKLMYAIYREQKQAGVGTMHWREGFRSLRNYFTYKKKATLNLTN